MRLIKSILPLVFVSLISITFFSCSKDNPVTPSTDTTYHYDSARYEWTTDVLFISNPSYKLFIPDTNNIYQLAANYLLKKSNGHFTYIQLPYSCSGFSGISNNEIYLACTEFLPKNSNMYINRLIKYDGEAFHILPFSEDTIPGEKLLSRVKAFSSNSIWFFSSENTIICEYDGLQFHFYNIDSGYSPTNHMVKNDEGVFLHAMKYSERNAGDTSRIYKFNGVNFISVFSEKAVNTFPSNFQMAEMENHIYSPRYDGLYKFNGNNFVKVISPPLHFQLNAGGKNENDFMIREYAGNPSDITYFLHWNGNKWSKEFRGLDDLLTEVIKAGDNYYLMYYEGFYCKLFTGRLKH